MEGSLGDTVVCRLPRSVINHPFSCDKCTGSFTRKEHLLRHYRTHENVKPFECSICGQNFGRKDLRDRHERNLHRKVRPPASRKTKTATTGSSEAETSPEGSSAAVPALEVQRLHLDLFFTCFASCMPIIHQATFRASKRYPGLVQCMAAIGASYSTDPIVQKMSMAKLRDEQNCLRQALSTVSVDDQNCLDLVIETLLISSFSLSQVESPGHEHSRHILHESINLARRLGLSKALASGATSPPATMHHRWVEWIKYESFKRIGLMLMVIDSVSCCLHNSPNQLSFLEMKHNMPVDEMIWNAGSAEEWQAACLSLSANSEMPLSDAMHLLLNSYRVPNTLNELSSILLSTCLLNSILELSAWKALYTLRTRNDTVSQQRFGNGPQYGPEINTREAQLRFSMNVLLERARNQRLTTNVPSVMWEVTSTIQQFAYLRLHLPSAQTVHGIVSSDWPSMMRQTMYSIVSEDLHNINYRPTTLLLNYFIELILSQVHLQLQESSGMSPCQYLATENPIGCVTLVQVMIDIWRLLRFTTLHEEQISHAPELSQARQAFLSTVRELTDSVGGSFLQGNIVQEDEVARSLTLVCTNMYHATRMSTFQVGADHFALLTRLITETTVDMKPRVQEASCDAWTMLSRSL